MYSVKEMHYTLQGEGAQVGRAAVFLRFAGCNLWTGKEEHRENAICKFCDTQFVGTDGENGGKFKFPMELAASAKALWDAGANITDGIRYRKIKPLVVCTGGEPLLQLDNSLIRCLHQQGFEVAIETNGTMRAPIEVDWICVSPKADSEIVQTSGNELKLVYPQVGNKPEDFQHLTFDHFFISPRDVSFEPDSYEGDLSPLTPTQEAIKYCLANPQWRLSLQTHKTLGLK